MKTCKKCCEVKSLDEFRRNASSADDRAHICKECFKIKDAKYRKDNPEKLAAIRLKWEEAHPGRAHELYEASYAVKAPEIRAKSTAHYVANKPAIAVSMREYRLRDPSAWKARIRRSKALKPDLYAEMNLRKEHSRRARKRLSEGVLSQGIGGRLFALQRGMCPCCNQPLGEDFHHDHIMPLALGGTNTDDNMQLLRQRCNNQKAAKHPVDFMQSRGFLL